MSEPHQSTGHPAAESPAEAGAQEQRPTQAAQEPEPTTSAQAAAENPPDSVDGAADADADTDSHAHPRARGHHVAPQTVRQEEVPPVVPADEVYPGSHAESALEQTVAHPMGYGHYGLAQPPSGPLPAQQPGYQQASVDQQHQAYPPTSAGQPAPGQQMPGGPQAPGHQAGYPQAAGHPQAPMAAPQQPMQVPPAQPQQQPKRGRHARANGDDLASAQLIKPVKRKPQSGWRKFVYVASGHLINPGESPKDRLKRELITRINQPLRGCYKIAMLSLKGGVGKTTTTATLGATFASLRGDRVIAVDANPDRGTLSQKIPMETTATVRHLLRDADRITKYSDIRAYTSQGSSRLEILASEQDPAVSEAFSEHDYRRTVDLLEHFYNIVLTDCGTGLMHSAMKGVLELADALVVVSSGSVDGARSASATLDWLDAHGYGDLVKRSVAVINSVRPKASSVDLDKLEAHFGARTRVVCRIPFDPHLEEGAEIELDRLQEETQLALLRLAAAVADAFPTQ
ncbi:AAA family ATPase [Thermocrispum sp.]|uniref:MinD/ParA family ATP-binding protein n=1 Tax=Thermocrispum sp. TaxID=2060768 RepID=UPI0025811645|nr:AAA family ATPase [Thermocrispum sp.]